MHKAIFVLSIIYLLATVAIFGYLSDGFVYLSVLRESFVVWPLSLGAATLAVLMLLARRSRDFLLNVLSVIAMAGSLGYVLNENHNLYGSWLPNPFERRVDTSGDASLSVHGQTVRYRLELHDPGTLMHREYLVITQAGVTRRVRLPLFKDTRSGYVEAKQPEDWIVLRATADRNVFEADTGRLLLPQRSFRINLAGGSVEALALRSIAEIHASPAK